MTDLETIQRIRRECADALQEQRAIQTARAQTALRESGLCEDCGGAIDPEYVGADPAAVRRGNCEDRFESSFARRRSAWRQRTHLS